MTQSNFTAADDIVNNGYYHLVADHGGQNLFLCANGNGTVSCVQNGVPGRQAKWSLMSAGNGLWYIRTAAPIVTGTTGTKLTNLDYSGGTPALSLYVSGSDEQKWVVVKDGSKFIIRPSHDSTRRIRANNNAAPSSELDSPTRPATAEWTLVPTSAV